MYFPKINISNGRVWNFDQKILSLKYNSKDEKIHQASYPFNLPWICKLDWPQISPDRTGKHHLTSSTRRCPSF